MLPPFEEIVKSPAYRESGLKVRNSLKLGEITPEMCAAHLQAATSIALSLSLCKVGAVTQARLQAACTDMINILNALCSEHEQYSNADEAYDPLMADLPLPLVSDDEISVADFKKELEGKVCCVCGEPARGRGDDKYYCVPHFDEALSEYEKEVLEASTKPPVSLEKFLKEIINDLGSK